MKKIVFALLALTIIFACNDDNETGIVNLEFKNSIENTPIELNSASYTNNSNESYTIAELKYIISNIVFIKENGEEFTYPVQNSYFLINEEVNSSKQVSLTNIDAGVYTKIRFGFGVDQSKYPIVSGSANFVPTAEEHGMLWNWSAGYKFLKFEGSFTPDGGTAGDFILHVGSHGANLDNYKEITLDIPNAMTISNGSTSTININADVAKIFDSTNTHSLEDKSDIQVDPDNAPKIAENVQTMFEIQ